VENHLLGIALAIILLPLTGALIAGLLGKLIGRTATHRTTISLMTVAFGLACYLFLMIVVNGHPLVEGVVYNWLTSGAFQFDVALLVDRLSTTMVFIVTFVSLMVHIYTIGYMADDPGYQRFFSYVSLFTFAMLVLVLANNFLLMFFGWEGVGLVSYLLIGFWFKSIFRESYW
jgi:NADH-quinone oxidoreductase subunit L